MNIFATDHPLTNVSALDGPSGRPRVFLLWTSLCVSLVLCPLFVGAVWLAMLDADSPDVPDPTWADRVFDVAGLVIAFPSVLAADAVASPVLESNAVLYTCTVLDGLFWSFVIAAVYRLLGRHFWRRLNAG